MSGLEARLLGDDVDSAAGFTDAIQRAYRALEELDPLDVSRIARRIEAAIGGHAIA